MAVGHIRRQRKGLFHLASGIVAIDDHLYVL